MSNDRKEYYKDFYKKKKEELSKKYFDNKEEILEKRKKYYEDNKDKIRDYNKKYKDENLEYFKEYNSNYYQENKEYLLERQKEYCQENRDVRLDYLRGYQKKPENIEKRKEYCKSKYENNLTYRLSILIRNNIMYCFNRIGVSKSEKTENILGCSFDEFRVYIESKFEPWMTWENQGKFNGEENYGWDIDHIIPTSTASTEEEILKLNNYTNLQPLCSYINRYVKKNNLNMTKCLSCGSYILYKKYCNDKCKSKYYYDTKENLRLYKKEKVKEKRELLKIIYKKDGE